MNQVKGTAAVFSRTAIRHDAVRPAWTAEVASWLLGSPVRGHELEVLDLGAGTGLGTRAIAALGHSVTAVDMDLDMLSVLRNSCRDLPPSVAARISAAGGSAENIPLADRCVDAIVCLQAWHWVDPEKATAECDRVLRHDGTMGLAWHTWDRTSEWVKALAAIVEPEGTPPDQTRSVPEGFAGGGCFERRDFPFVYQLSVDQLVQLATSWTFVTRRSDQRAVLAKIRHLGELAMTPGTGLVDFPHITAAFRLQRPVLTSSTRNTRPAGGL